jgi:two-component system, LytTR family, response regulator AlgR
MKPTLIIADDLEAVREELVRGLQEDFDIVAEVHDGFAAIEACLRFNPKVILLDVMMPGCGGIEAAMKIRSEVMPIPKIVFLSALQDPKFVQTAFEAGASDYLFKPIDIKKIAATLWACVREDIEEKS